jgi:hypothetical protein
MNVFYAFAAYPAGVLSDNSDRIAVLGLGLGILVAADLVLALTNGIAGVTVGVGLWGLHMGFILIDEVSDEALEAAAFVALGGLPTLMYRTYCFSCPSDPLRSYSSATRSR